MAAYFYCDKCGRQHNWAEKFAGKVAQCKCKAKVRVPDKAVPDAARPVFLESADRAYVYCNQCGRQYKWQAEAAGRTFRCGCGNTLRAPTLRPGSKPTSVDDPADSDFDLFGDDDMPSPPVQRPAARPPVKPAAQTPTGTPGSQSPTGTPGGASGVSNLASGSDSEEVDLLSATDQGGVEDIGERSTLVKEPIRGGPDDDDDSDFDLGGGLGDSGGKDEEDSEVDFFSDEPAEVPATVACPGCGKQYVWKPEVAGLAAPCRCGAKIVMPAHKPGTSPDDSSEMEFDEKEKENLMASTSAKGGFICDECGNMIPPGKVICKKCGYNSETGEMTR
ncbi:MAG: hypothetical protein GC159_01595 [Phycisphaera sp.]|nr:hypothetical protein [Phycisphaera sp.]